MPRQLASLPAILLVTDLLHPVDNLIVELFLNSDVRHGRGRGGAVPMLLPRCNPDHVTGPDFLNRASPALGPAATGRDDEGLPERMRMPCRPRAGFEGYAGALNDRRLGLRAESPYRNPLSPHLLLLRRDPSA